MANVLAYGTVHALRAEQAVPVVSGLVRGASTTGLVHLAAILLSEHELDAGKMAARRNKPTGRGSG